MVKQWIEKEEDSMDFEYNGNLLEDDRINLVANEIIKNEPKNYDSHSLL